jgi:hypothetical protein
MVIHELTTLPLRSGLNLFTSHACYLLRGYLPDILAALNKSKYFRVAPLAEYYEQRLGARDVLVREGSWRG